MNGPRVLVFAYSDVGYACLSTLIKRKANIVGVFTHENNPRENIWFPSVAELAEKHGIPAFIADDFKSEDNLILVRGLQPDLILSFYYRNLIPTEILSLPRLGAYNMHGSLLPKYRGRAPVNWAVLHGEKRTGATLHVMLEKPDAGDIVDQKSVSIGPNDTTAVVQSRVTKAAAAIIAKQIPQLLKGAAKLRPQDHSQSTYFGRRKPEDGFIFWHQPAGEIHNLIRAVSHPYPGAFTDIFETKTYIWASRVPSRAPALTPGEIKAVKGRLFIGCGKGAIEVLRIQREGEEETTAKKFIQQAKI